MLHAAGFLMSWLTGKRAHILSISVFSHSRLSHLLCSSSLSLSLSDYLTPPLSLSLLLCLAHTNEHLIFIHVYIFCSILWFLHSNCVQPCNNPAHLFALLFYRFCFLLPISLFASSPPPLSYSLPFHFVRCHRVLLVLRALLTLSLLPLTVWWDLTVR